MKILCVADHVDPIVYSGSVKQRFSNVELVISCGDLPFSYYDFIKSMLNKPLLYVFGNHNLRQLRAVKEGAYGFGADSPLFGMQRIRRIAGGTYIGNKVIREKGLIIAGLGGSLWYNGGENQFTDFQMRLKVLKLIPRLWLNKLRFGRYLDILVTHAPPLGIHDRPDRCHTGFKVFLWFMKIFKPGYLIHGHIHLYSFTERRKTQYLSTTVINAYDHQVIDLEA